MKFPSAVATALWLSMMVCDGSSAIEDGPSTVVLDQILGLPPVYQGSHLEIKATIVAEVGGDPTYPTSIAITYGDSLVTGDARQGVSDKDVWHFNAFVSPTSKRVIRLIDDAEEGHLTQIFVSTAPTEMSTSADVIVSVRVPPGGVLRLVELTAAVAPDAPVF